MPWSILSAEHGLVGPDEELDPYDRALGNESRTYVDAWVERVLAQLRERCEDLAGLRIEIHAPRLYARIATPLRRLGAEVVLPVEHLRQGEQLQWYDSARAAHDQRGTKAPSECDDLVGALTREADAMTPRSLLATGRSAWQTAGLYSWWVDEAGAADLSAGLDCPVTKGLVYAGQAGATHHRSGKASNNTLWGRIAGMHLGGRHTMSTLRLSLGSILACQTGASSIDEVALTAWMTEHMSVVMVRVADADRLDDLETVVLGALDPPLNLSKRPPTALRSRLSELRRRYGQRGPGGAPA